MLKYVFMFIVISSDVISNVYYLIIIAASVVLMVAGQAPQSIQDLILSEMHHVHVENRIAAVKRCHIYTLLLRWGLWVVAQFILLMLELRPLVMLLPWMMWIRNRDLF